MTQKLRWTSKAAKPCIQVMHAALLSGNWCDIFGAGFQPSDIDFKTFHESDNNLANKFLLKQVHKNLTNWLSHHKTESNGHTKTDRAELARGHWGGGIGLDGIKNGGFVDLNDPDDSQK